MFRFVLAGLALIAVQNLPISSIQTSLSAQGAEAPARDAEDQPLAMVSVGWLDVSGGIGVTP